MSQKTQISSLLLCRTTAHLRCRFSIFGLAVFALFALSLLLKPAPVVGVAGRSAQAARVSVVSAASFANAVAPDSIASGFGARLATRTEVATSAILPTALAGTTVRINGELAPLFFVSESQVNFLIPVGVPAGTASIVITAGDGAVSQGTAQIAAVAPALFTANGTGQGALAALLLRIKASGQQLFEPLAQFDQATSRFVSRPIEFGEESDQLYLILFLTGLRQAPPNNVRVSLGGVEFAPLYAGRQGDLAGVDQINLALPRSFGGRGRITLFVRASGASTSNIGEFEIGAGTQMSGNNAPLQISPPTQAVLAGSEMEIGGSGFAANPNENTVQIVADDGVTTKAEVLSVSSTALRIRLPFGAGTGQLKVSRGQFEASAAIHVQTSVSGFVERFDQGRRVPIAGARVRVKDQPATERATDAEGSFILFNLQPTPKGEFEILPPRDNSLNFPPTIFSKRVNANRDNQLPRGAEQTVIAGVVLPLSDENGNSALATQTAGPEQVTPLVTFLSSGRTPANLPAGHFSTSIALVTPFGVTFNPGRKLTFPNNDAIPPGTQATLYKFDSARGTEQTSFVEIGKATVSADGQRIETASNAITEGSYYFVSIARPVAAINGRVVESDGRPALRAIVQARGQSTFTDGFGGFVLRDVPVLKPSGDRVQVEVSYQRPDGRIARKNGDEIEIREGALSTIGREIILDPENRNFPPVILAPASLMVEEGRVESFGFLVIRL